MTTKPSTLSKDPRSMRLPKAQYANLNFVTDSLAIGGDLNWKRSLRDLQVAEIVKLGITCVIDARIEDDDTAVWAKAGITYVHVPTDDREGSHIDAKYFDAAVKAARAAKLAGGKVLAHCHMGINRGPSMGAAILLDRGMAPVDVIKLILKNRPQAGIYYFMDAYDADVARRGATPNKALRQHVWAAYTSLVRNSDHLQHVTRALAAHHLQDREGFKVAVAEARAEWQDKATEADILREWALEDQERWSGVDSRIADREAEDQAWWDQQDLEDLEWQTRETERQAKDWAQALTEAEIEQVKADDLFEWIKSVK